MQPSSQMLTSQQKQLATDVKNVTKDYLVKNVGNIGSRGKMFCVYTVLDIEPQSSGVNEYVFTLCQEYYLSNGELKDGTGTDLPVALFLQRSDDGYKVVDSKIPGPGDEYWADIKKFFPEKTFAEIRSLTANYAQGQKEAELEAKAYYGK